MNSKYQPLTACNKDNPLYKNKEWLEKYYIEKDKTQNLISKKCGVSQAVISYWGRKHDLKKIERTTEEYKKEIKEIHGDKIKALEEYKGTKTKITHYCDKHDYRWKAYPGNILRGHECPKCGNEKIGRNNRKKHNEYVRGVQRVHGKDITVVENYKKNNKTQIEHKCNICNYYWRARPKNILNGKGCPKCANRDIGEQLRKSHAQYMKEVEKIHKGEITVLGTYEKNYKKIKHKCNICGNVWETKPQVILRGNGCPKCGIKKRAEQRRKSQSQYVKEVEEIHGEDIVVIGDYYTTDSHLLHKCNKCGYKWKVRPADILQGYQCPHCNFNSTGEQKVKKILDELGIRFEREVGFNNCRNKKKLPFDFGIKENQKTKALIEFDGVQHYKPIDYFGGKAKWRERVHRDCIKDQFALSNNIPLLRVNYMDKKKKEIQHKIYSFLINHGIIQEHTKPLLF